jgi:hypothetical protein
MDLKMPSPEQAFRGLRAMKTVAMADGELSASEPHMSCCEGVEDEVQALLSMGYH